VRRRAAGGALVLSLTLLLAAEVHGQGWLGVRIRDLSEIEMEEISARHGIREGYGVVIVAVLEDSPAARSAVRAGDIVVGFAGRPIVDSRTFQRVVGAAPLDRGLPLTVLRREGRRQLMVRLAPMPVEIAGERVAAEFGFSLREVYAERYVGISLGPMESLPVIADVYPGSEAERAGLEPGDVFRKINDEPLQSFRHATQLLARAPAGEPLRLVVRRGGQDALSFTLTRPPSR
jgi:serine protease Do